MVSPLLFTLFLAVVAAQPAGTRVDPVPSSSALSARFPWTNGTGAPGQTGTGTAVGTGIIGTAIATVTTRPDTTMAMATPSNVVTGGLTLPAPPSSCTGSIVPFKTSVPVLGSQLSVWDHSQSHFWYFNKPGNLWTFSTSTTGVALGNPFWDQGVPPPILPRQNGSSVTANISATGDGQLIFQIFSSNTTEMPPASSWNVSTQQRWAVDGNPLFWLEIEGSGPCANPIPTDQSCAAGTLQLNRANWLAFGVDDWLAGWVKSAGPFSTSASMMTKFATQFMNNVCKPCTYDQPCNCQGSCASLPDGGKGPDAERIWLAWKAIENLSDMVNNIWESIVVADTDALSNIGNIALDFVDPTIAITQGVAPEDKISKANHILGALSPWLNFLAPFVFPEAEIGVKIFGAALGFTSAMLTMEDKPGSAPITAHSDQLNTVLGAQGGLLKYVQSLKQSIESLHNDIFTNGANITDYLNGGAFANRTMLGLDCDTCKQDSQAWTMQYLSLKTMNYVWWVQNVFISYVPYGTVISNFDGQPTQFTEDICASVFLKGDPDLVWCHTDDAVAGTALKPGMARLTYYDKLAAGDSPNHPNPGPEDSDHGTLNMTTAAPGVKSSMQFSTTSPDVKYTFNKTDVMASSLAGFAKFGFGGDGVAAAMASIRNAAQALRVHDAAQSFQDMFKVSATTPGMFTLPVCVSYNLNYWPTVYGTKDHPRGDHWCVCNTPFSVDMHGTQFHNSTPAVLTDLVTLLFHRDGQQSYCLPDYWGQSAPGLTQDQMPPTMV